MLNVKDHQVFSEKLMLNVLDLTHPQLATEEDQKYGIDQWAKLFKAKTWEEIRMIAERDECMSRAVETLYETNADEMIKEQCLAREEYYRHEAMVQQRLAEQERELAEQKQELAKKDHALAEKDHALAEKDQLLAEQKREIARLKELLDRK